MRIIAAAVFYFLIVFGVGFVMGPVRVFWLEPRLGETVATHCEASLLLCAIVLAAPRLPGKLGLRPSIASQAGLGVGAVSLSTPFLGLRQLVRPPLDTGGFELPGFAHRIRCNAYLGQLVAERCCALDTDHNAGHQGHPYAHWAFFVGRICLHGAVGSAAS